MQHRMSTEAAGSNEIWVSCHITQLNGLGGPQMTSRTAAPFDVADARHPTGRLGGGGRQEPGLLHPKGRRHPHPLWVLDEGVAPRVDSVAWAAGEPGVAWHTIVNAVAYVAGTR